MKIIYSTFKHKVTSTLKLLKLLCDDVYISKTFLFLEMIETKNLYLFRFARLTSFIKLLEIMFFQILSWWFPFLTSSLVSACFGLSALYYFKRAYFCEKLFLGLRVSAYFVWFSFCD